MDSHATGKLMLPTTLNHKQVPSTANTSTADSAKSSTEGDRQEKSRSDSASDSTQHTDDTLRNMLHPADLACPGAQPTHAHHVRALQQSAATIKLTVEILYNQT